MSCSSRWCANRRVRGARPADWLAALFAGLLTLGAAGALATPTAPPNSAASLSVAELLPQARLAGSGRLTWFGLHIYDAALYVPAQGGGPLATQRFVLELRYARALAGRAIADTSRDEIARLGFGSAAQRTRWHEQMRALFPDVAAERRIAGLHLPGQGARFYFDGRFLGAIDDPDFAQAFFAIWLDERSRSPELRRALLAGLDRPERMTPAQ